MSRYKVWCVDFEDEDAAQWIENAHGASDAAIDWAGRYDQDGDYMLSKGNERTVMVRNAEGALFTFVVGAEVSPTYWCRRAEPKP